TSLSTPDAFPLSLHDALPISRRVQHDGDRQSQSRDRQLYQSPNRLDHDQAISGLNPGPLQAVVKNRVLIREQVKARGMVHHANRSEEHTSELQSLTHIVCRLL